MHSCIVANDEDGPIEPFEDRFCPPAEEGSAQQALAFELLDELLISAFATSEHAFSEAHEMMADAATSFSSEAFGVPLLVLTPEQLERLIYHEFPMRMQLKSKDARMLLTGLRSIYQFIDQYLSPALAQPGLELTHSRYVPVMRSSIVRAQEARSSPKKKTRKSSGSKRRKGATADVKFASLAEEERQEDRLVRLDRSGLPPFDIEKIPPVSVERHPPDDPFEGFQEMLDDSFHPWIDEIEEFGPRPSVELDRPYDPEETVLHALGLRRAGRLDEARQLLRSLIDQDPSDIDAYGHLALIAFEDEDDVPKAHALYARGVAIGNRAIGSGRDVMAFWGCNGNRPFLRCLHGVGICQWRQKMWPEARRTLNRLLWLSPHDNQGVRFILPKLRKRNVWRRDAD